MRRSELDYGDPTQIVTPVEQLCIRLHYCWNNTVLCAVGGPTLDTAPVILHVQDSPQFCQLLLIYHKLNMNTVWKAAVICTLGNSSLTSPDDDQDGGTVWLIVTVVVSVIFIVVVVVVIILIVVLLRRRRRSRCGNYLQRLGNVALFSVWSFLSH